MEDHAMLMQRSHRPTPAAMISPFGRDFDQLFQTVFTPGLLSFGVPASRPATFPALNITEDESAIYVEAELPGFKHDQVEINVVGNQLTITGERSETTDEKNTAYHRRERWTGSFERSVVLPTEVDADRVAAELRNGVLTITLPKPEVARPRTIQVKTA